ncbi:MAG: hypothetical protein HDQ88_08755 [Clostridia bacterium]|nr:hypothetical protein [Clostridia bacterium]
MHTYYFTYGNDEKFPYQHGWTEITAPSLICAQQIFRACHPNRKNDDGTESGCLNYSWHYTEDEFKETRMYEDDDNLGAGCVERISMERLMIEMPDDYFQSDTKG